MPFGAVILVLSSNTATYFIATTLQNYPIDGGIGRLQIALILCYIPFGAMRSWRPEDSPISGQK